MTYNFPGVYRWSEDDSDVTQRVQRPEGVFTQHCCFFEKSAATGIRTATESSVVCTECQVCVPAPPAPQRWGAIVTVVSEAVERLVHS